MTLEKFLHDQESHKRQAQVLAIAIIVAIFVIAEWWPELLPALWM